MTEESMPKLLGIDVGSTTVKVSVIDGENIIYGSYVRHFSKVKETVLAELKKIVAQNEQIGERIREIGILHRNRRCGNV